MAHYLFIDTAGSRSAGKRGNILFICNFISQKLLCAVDIFSPLLHVFIISTTVLGAEKMVPMIDFTKKFMICIFCCFHKKHNMFHVMSEAAVKLGGNFASYFIIIVTG